MTQQDVPGDSSSADPPAESAPLEYQAPAPDRPAPQATPWFGYIGLGIALVSMLLGIAAVIFAIFWFVGWTRS